jgi:hypothetical protein
VAIGGHALPDSEDCQHDLVDVCHVLTFQVVCRGLLVRDLLVFWPVTPVWG